MVVIDEMSYSEIGKVLSISKMTVCEIYNAALKKLKRICKNV